MTLLNKRSERIYLRPLRIEDAVDVFDYAKDPDVKRYIGWPLMKTLEETTEFLKTLIERHEAKTHVYASVVEAGTEKVIGTLMLFNFDWDAKHGEIGYVFHKNVWGKGYCTEASKWFIEHAFETLELRKIFARVVSQNEGSSKVLLKSGFEKEAVLKDMYCIEGQLLDCVYYSRVKG